MITVKTLFNEPRTASQAAYITRIMGRAEKLETEGYELIDQSSGYYAVTKPGCFELYPFGDYGYDVNLNEGREKCSCEGFAKDGDCKHRIACAMDAAKKQAAEVLTTEEEFAMWDAICAKHEADMENAELETTGTDPNYYLDPQ